MENRKTTSFHWAEQQQQGNNPTIQPSEVNDKKKKFWLVCLPFVLYLFYSYLLLHMVLKQTTENIIQKTFIITLLHPSHCNTESL
jgi:hypothetical protein